MPAPQAQSSVGVGTSGRVQGEQFVTRDAVREVVGATADDGVEHGPGTESDRGEMGDVEFVKKSDS